MANEKLPRLNPTDQKIIEQLQDLLGEKLEPVPVIEWNTQGYVVNQAGAVVGLGLYNFEIDDKKLASVAGTLVSPVNLTQLNLSENQITDLSGLGEWPNLTRLNLCENQIKELPAGITERGMEIYCDSEIHTTGIDLENNPLVTPPVEIVKQGREAIRNYFRQIEKQGKDYIYEAKLMIVGEPGAGKTTLVDLLFNRNSPVPKQGQKSTLGVEVRPNLPFAIDTKTTVKAHAWDFGGQQIQYMLHQFFLTTDCVYVLMAEKRKELANFDYWLNIINILGKNSPVIVLFNEIDITIASSFIYDEKKYSQELFPDLSLHRYDVNLAEINDGRFDVLVNVIREKIAGLEHIGKEVPARWVDIRNIIEERRPQKLITIQEYFSICGTCGIDGENDRMWILRYFHLLGIVLHFAEDDNLCDIIFLDPNWTVDAVYSVLTNEDFKNNNGIFTKAEVDRIWMQKNYAYAERAKLFQLMLKNNFELCYKLPDSQDQYIVPLLLPQIQPDYHWDERNNLQFRFQYPFMPKGIVSRLIVRMHEYVDGAKLWQEGAVFAKGGAIGQVVEKETTREGLKIIEIRLNGSRHEHKELLTIIRNEIEKIQRTSFPKLPYSEMIPCTCSECYTSTSPYFFDYKDILTYLCKKKSEIDCRKSTDKILIRNLIGSVFEDEEIKKRLSIDEKGARIIHDQGNITFKDCEFNADTQNIGEIIK